MKINVTYEGNVRIFGRKNDNVCSFQVRMGQN